MPKILSVSANVEKTSVEDGLNDDETRGFTGTHGYPTFRFTHVLILFRLVGA